MTPALSQRERAPLRRGSLPLADLVRATRLVDVRARPRQRRVQGGCVRDRRRVWHRPCVCYEIMTPTASRSVIRDVPGPAERLVVAGEIDDRPGEVRDVGHAVRRVGIADRPVGLAGDDRPEEPLSDDRVGGLRSEVVGGAGDDDRDVARRVGGHEPLGDPGSGRSLPVRGAVRQVLPHRGAAGRAVGVQVVDHCEPDARAAQTAEHTFDQRREPLRPVRVGGLGREVDGARPPRSPRGPPTASASSRAIAVPTGPPPRTTWAAAEVMGIAGIPLDDPGGARGRRRRHGPVRR